MAPGRGQRCPSRRPGEAYAHVEGARGDLGIYLASDGGISPYRMHVHAPSFINLAMLQEKLVGMKISDVIALLGSIDIVLGEVDPEMTTRKPDSDDEEKPATPQAPQTPKFLKVPAVPPAAKQPCRGEICSARTLP